MNTVNLNTSATSSAAIQFGAQNFKPRNNSEVAYQVASLFYDGRDQEATNLLNQARQGQPPAVQDALDRMVAARLEDMSDRFSYKTLPPSWFRGAPEVGGPPSPPPALRLPTSSLPVGPPSVLETMGRINAAGANRPATPDVYYQKGPGKVLTELTDQQKFDVYASIVETRGNQAAIADLNNGKRVVLGLRNEDTTLANSGQGYYNDRVVVLWKGADGVAHVKEFFRANTEPTAQYDGHHSKNPDVTFRRVSSVTDLNGDGVTDLGRVREGTIEVTRSKYKQQFFALAPTSDAVRNGRTQIERDVNGDGKFDAKDGEKRFSPLDGEFKHHQGFGAGNTDSAGCTTIHPEDFEAFKAALTDGTKQANYQYVLTRTQ
jgi:hypothetical protein